MTEKKALKEAVKRWGKTACVEHKTHALFKDARESAEKELAQWREEAKTATPEQANELKELCKKNQWKTWVYPFNVGKIVLGMFFEVNGRGDSWEQALYEADWRDAKWHDEYVYPTRKCTFESVEA